jgi:ethanolamine utilization cobalamin adenosyltransferase
MKVITESFLRETFRKDVPETFRVEEGQIVTPSARQFLSEKSVKIVRDEEPVKKEVPVKSEELKPDTKEESFVSAEDGGVFNQKPGYMTRLHGNKVVPKDHPRIVFRAALDSLQSKILLAQFRVSTAKKTKLLEDLGEILEMTRDLMRAEVLDKTIGERKILGLSYCELRDQCHNPKKYFGTEHIIPSFDMGDILLRLNMLRTAVREIEVSAVTAFRNKFEFEKPDIIQALNSMSSAFYIMMLREKTGNY